MKESEAEEKLCPILTNPGKEHCRASYCMLWEPEYEEEIRTHRYGQEIPEGWNLKPSPWKAVSQDEYKDQDKTEARIFRYMPTDSGDCGLKSKESGCFYPG